MSTETYVKRLENAQDALRERGIDALILGPSADLSYLTGIHAHVSERLNLFVLPAEGDPNLVVPGLEAPLVKDGSGRVQLTTWGDADVPADLAAGLIGGAQKVAVGNTLWSAFLLRLQERLRDVTWQEGDPVLRDLRMIKDAEEIAALGEAGRLTDEAWLLFVQQGGPLTGLTELQALKKLITISEEVGLESPNGIIGTGPHSASPHHSGNDRVIQDGDALVFDWGGQISGYYSDVTRSAHIGEPSEEYRTVYDIVNSANQAAFEAVKPGTPLQEIDRAARKVITDAGYGEYFFHRVGHGLGLEIHEEPFLVEGNTLPLQAGMVFSDEPGIYIEGKFGVRIEDAVVCEEHGGRRLNTSTHELFILE